MKLFFDAVLYKKKTIHEKNIAFLAAQIPATTFFQTPVPPLSPCHDTSKHGLHTFGLDVPKWGGIPFCPHASSFSGFARFSAPLAIPLSLMQMKG